MKHILPTITISLCFSFFTMSTWADNSSRTTIGSKVSASQNQLNAINTNNSQRDLTEEEFDALLSGSNEDDELDSFITQHLNDYTAILAADPLGNLLDDEGFFDTQNVQQSVVSAAFNYLNTPYKWGGNNYKTGFDCSGLVMAIYRQVANTSLPRTTAMQAEATTKINRNDLEPGDLVFFNTAGNRRYSHVGIYVGDNKFIHAPRTGAQVRIDNINNNYWNKRFTGARRVITR